MSRIIDIRGHQFAATLRPGRTLAGVAQHGTDRLLGGEKRARDGATDLTCDSRDGVHDPVARRFISGSQCR